MAVKFVAVIDGRNNPVVFKSEYSGIDDSKKAEVDLNHQFIARMALDFIRVPDHSRPQPVGAPSLLLVHDRIAVYGALNNIKMKVLIGIDSLSEPGDLPTKFKTVFDAYTRYLCNPFRKRESSSSTSPRFSRSIETIFDHPQQTSRGNSDIGAQESTAKDTTLDESASVTKSENSSAVAVG